MGRTALWITVAAMVILLVGAWPADAQFTAGTGILNSRHDFRDDAWFIADPDHNNTYQKTNVCRVCHKPHHAMEAASSLLWNHELSTASYTMYDSSWSSTIDGAQDPQPSGTSRLCLGCHDGTVALENWDGVTTGTTFADSLGASLGVDLEQTHPISIEYDEAADTGLNPTSTAMPTGSTIAEVLDFGKVQCRSCHDVHNVETTSGHMLTRGSGHDLCLTCHNK